MCIDMLVVPNGTNISFKFLHEIECYPQEAVDCPNGLIFNILQAFF
jgi:hypothetical protein